MLRSKRSYKSDSGNTELLSKSQAISRPEETYSKEQKRHVPSVHKENWDCNEAVKYRNLRGSKNMPTVLKKDSSKSVENQRRTSTKLKRSCCDQLEEIIPKKALKSMDFKRKDDCQENTSSPLINIRRSSRKANSKYRTKMPDEAEANEANGTSRVNCDHHTSAGKTLLQQQGGNNDRSETKIEEKPLKTEIKLRSRLERHGSKTDVGKSISSKDETVDCGTPMRKNSRRSVTSHGGVARDLFENTETQADDQVPVNIITNKASEKTKKFVPTELIIENTKRKRHKKLEVVPVPVKRKEEQKLSSHMVHSYKRYIEETGREKGSYIRRTFSQITIAKSNGTGIGMNQDVVHYKNACVDVNSKVSVIPLIRIEDMPLSQLSELLQPADTREINKAYYEKKMQHSAYVTKVERNKEINVLYRQSVCEKQHINMIKEVDANVNRETSSRLLNVPSKPKLIDDIRILKLYNNGRNSRFTIEDVLQFYLKFRDLTYRTIKEGSAPKRMHTCAAMCDNCKQAFDLLQHFSGKVNLKNEKLSVECIPCNLRINFLSHLQEHVMNVHLKCEGKGNNDDYPIHVINFDKKLKEKNVRVICACCCCSKIFQTTRWFESHINKRHRFKIFTNGSSTCPESQQIVKEPQLYELYKNVNTPNEDYTLNRNPIFDSIASNINDICSQRRDINLVNQNSIQSCINTQEVNISNSVYCNDSNNQSTLLEWSMKLKQKNIILQKNNDPNCSRGKINKIIEAAPIIKKQNKRLHRYKTRGRQRRRYDVRKGRSESFICHSCSKVYKYKKCLLTHITFHCNGPMMLDEQEADDTSDNSASKLHQDSVASNAGITNLSAITNSEEPSQPKTPGDTMMIPDDKQVDDAGNENVEYVANEDGASTKNDDNSNQILCINHVEESELATKMQQQSFQFNISITKVCKKDIKARKEITEDKGENELLVSSLNQNEQETDTTQETNINTSNEWCCDICDEQFALRTMLNDHIFFEHDKELLIGDMKSWNQLSTELPFNNEKNEPPRDSYILEKRNDQVSKLKKRNGSLKTVLATCQVYKKSKKWRCGECNENFAFLRNYLRHKYDCHEDESVVHICDNCNRILTSVKMVNTHVCMKVTTWACKRCNLYFPNGISLMRHNEHLHFETVGPHVCEMCGSTFLTDHMLRKHRNKHANDDSDNLNQLLKSNEESDLPSTSNVKIQPINDGAISSDKNQLQSEVLEELNKTFSEMYITCDVENGQEVLFKCNNCDALRATESEMTEHLIECCKLDKCQICNFVNPAYKLREHLIHEHLVADNLYIQDDIVERRKDSITDTTNILGLRRLLSLYEYQKFDGHLECIQCDLCPEQFSSSQLYKIHYLKYHDKICLLCNIEFDHNVQALEHKIKIHKSIDLYLWIVQMLILAASRLGNYGNTIEQVILKSSEIRMC